MDIASEAKNAEKEKDKEKGLFTWVR